MKKKEIIMYKEIFNDFVPCDIADETASAICCAEKKEYM